MIAYTLTTDHVPLVLDGAKTFTLRKVGRKKHVAVGERFAMDLVPNMATPPFATALCVFRARAVLTADGLLRVSGVEHQGDRGEGLAFLFTAAEQGAYQADAHQLLLAQRDGFDGWDALWAWNLGYQGQPSAKRLLREVIGWTDVQAAT